MPQVQLFMAVKIQEVTPQSPASFVHSTPVLLYEEGAQGIPSAIAGALERNPAALFFAHGFPFSGRRIGAPCSFPIQPLAPAR